MTNEHYRTQVDLLIRILPHIAEEDHFALKGGTAINMFIWDMPRLSVDIDLTYLPFDTRDIALANIANALERLKNKISKTIPGIQIKTMRIGDDPEAKLICTLGQDQIKVEVNTIMRGSIELPSILSLSSAAQKEFNKFTEIRVMSNGELFGGEICAALDRQHPRDLFDISQLFENGGITEEIKKGFIAALLSHNRPMHEIFKPNLHNQKEAFVRQFEGMAFRSFSYVDFENTREKLIKEIKNLLTVNDKQLFLSFKSGNPDWSLIDIEKLQYLPAVRWKLKNIQNLAKQKPEKHIFLIKCLEDTLSYKYK
jgi:predicted nucleotidyltransferase component of viral defense system